MISHLSGKAILISETFAVIDVGGIGYKVFMTGQNLGELKENMPTSVFTHLAVRENALDLYGFPNQNELSFFELLITISGIGPKTALGILNVAPVSLLRQAVFTENTSHLTKVSGIGKKNAEKIVIELRGKLIGEYQETDGVPNDSDAIEALTSLGYSQKEARESLKEVSKELTSPADRVKQALKILGKNN
jgi:Holliday junction DNA helicase RuvA